MILETFFAPRRLLALLSAGFLASASAQDQPNVLFIAVDDLVPTLGCYGDTTALTPEIDGLASQGMTFLNHHCQWAVCGPSRAALTTSLMPEETGVMGFKPIRAVLPDVITLPQHFRNQGYETAGAGKFHDPRTVGTITDPNGPTASDTEDLPSWSVPYVEVNGGFNPAGKPAVDETDQADSLYTDHMILTEGLGLIDTLAAGSKPFFLAVGFKKPHLPFVAPQRFWDLYDRNSMPLATFTGLPVNATSYTNTTLTDNDELLGYEPYDVSGLPTEAQQRELLHGYYACVSMIDAWVGDLRDKLAATPDPVQAGKMLSETTIVVLWGDHGFHLGDHGRWAKHTAMEQGTRCPLIIFDPRNPTGPGSNSTISPANTIDIYPTLCELANLPVPEQPLSDTVTTGRPLRGRSLVPVIEDPAASVHFGAISQFNTGGQYGFSYRTERFRYIEWVASNGNVNGRDLYDYQVDPLETRNVAGDPAYEAIVYQLSRAMRAETTTNGTVRLNAATAIATGADAFLPDVSIAPLGGGNLRLEWPWSGGVSYDVLGSPDLTSGSWVADVESNSAGSVELPMTAPRRFYQIGFGANTPPVFTSDPVAWGEVAKDVAITGTLASVGIDVDMLTFTKVDGPAWLTVGSDGTLGGTPTVSEMGANWFTVEATDPDGATARAKLEITVVDTTPPPTPVVIEQWLFEETAGTQFSGLINSAGSASFSGDKSNVTADGSGNLAFAVGADATDNVFRNATLTTAGRTSGVFEMEWTYSAADLGGGDAGGANVGFGFRDSGGNDLFNVRLHKQSGTLRLQTRVAGSNVDLENFGGTTVADLRVKVVADLDARTFDVFWQVGAGPELSTTGIAMDPAGLTFDDIRMLANTNTDDWGPSDSVSVADLTLSEMP